MTITTEVNAVLKEVGLTNSSYCMEGGWLRQNTDAYTVLDGEIILAAMFDGMKVCVSLIDGSTIPHQPEAMSMAFFDCPFGEFSIVSVRLFEETVNAWRNFTAKVFGDFKHPGIREAM